MSLSASASRCPPSKRLLVGEFELDQPADLEICARPFLRQTRQPHRTVRCRLPKLVYLQLEPTVKVVGRDRDTRLATDSELNHAQMVDLKPTAGNGCQPA